MNIKAKTKSKYLSRHRQGIYVLVVTFITLWSIPAGYQAKYDDREMKKGVSFSVKYADELGVDWKEAFTALNEDVGVKHFRLMSYWDLIEPENNEFAWEDLDWQVETAKRNGADVTLSVGLKQPRWPECHFPVWADNLEEQELRDEIKGYLTELVGRYKDNKTIISYQVDNEAANNVFGHCPKYDAHFLEEEMKLIKSIDSEKEIITNVSNQSGLPMNGPVEIADKVGLSVYKRAHFDAFGRKWFWSFFYVPSEWHSLRAALIEGLDDKPVFIHELQGEPWGEDITANLSIEEQNMTMDETKLKEIVGFAEQIGTDEIYLWGGEWWYWRYTDFGDTKLWDEVKRIYRD